jgi:phosphoribosylamine--glycine ligase
MAFVETLDAPFVVKVDGLAAGKGVTIAEDRASAERALQDSLVRKVFGDSGARVVVEEFLEGEEVTALGLTDGSAVIPLALAQDYKRALDGDRGPNTGGMGAYSPLPFVVPGERKEQIEGVLRATVAAMASMGIEYRGVLYAGLMLTDRGARVLEFNCRFGDPETQAILPRLTSNLTELLLACVEGNLADCTAEWTAQACVAVVLASHGYPGDYPTGVPIEGLDRVRDRDGVQAFHAGTAVRDGRVVTSGGRVVTVSALGEGLDDARRRAYEACGLIEFEGKTLRGDVAQRIQGAA